MLHLGDVLAVTFSPAGGTSPAKRRRGPAMQEHHWIVGGTVVAYAALGELAYWSDRPIRDAYGDCVRAPADFDALSLGLVLAVCIASASLLALSGGRVWRARTAAGAALALLAGAGLGGVWYHFRMSHGAQCPLVEFYGWYSDMPRLRELVLYSAAAGVVAVLSIPLGYLARGVRTALGRLRR